MPDEASIRASYETLRPNTEQVPVEYQITRPEDPLARAQEVPLYEQAMPSISTAMPSISTPRQ